MGFCSKSNKKAGLNFEERKLRVLYVAPPQPPSPIHEGSEEDYSPRASVLDNGNFSAPKFLAAASRAFLEQYEPQYKTTKERMMDLTVEIDGVIGTMEEALRRYTGTEILNGENKYKCGRCKSYEKAKKKLTIIEAPNILTIALKRFQVLSGLEILSAQPTGKLQPIVTVHNKSDSLQSPIDITNEKLVHSMMVS